MRPTTAACAALAAAAALWSWLRRRRRRELARRYAYELLGDPRVRRSLDPYPSSTTVAALAALTGVAAAKVRKFSAGARAGAKIGANGKLYATGGYTFGDIDDPYVGAGYQHKLGQNLYAKAEYRHQFIENFGDFDTFVAGVGFAF